MSNFLKSHIARFFGNFYCISHCTVSSGVSTLVMHRGYKGYSSSLLIYWKNPSLHAFATIWSIQRIQKNWILAVITYLFFFSMRYKVQNQVEYLIKISELKEAPHFIIWGPVSMPLQEHYEVEVFMPVYKCNWKNTSNFKYRSWILTVK